MMTYRILTGMVVLMMATSLSAAIPTADEMSEARLWTSARFEGKVETPTAKPGLMVLANNDPVQRNGRHEKPMVIAGKQYTRGLYCHAVSKVIVRLPSPGKTLSAVVGVDSNEQTSGGRGSVVFVVKVGGGERFNSGVMREGMPGVPVSIDLGGATEFALEVGDAGDGISCDQSDWADAQVTLTNGEKVWLGELPIIEDRARTYSTDPPFSFVYGGKPSAELLKTWKMERSSKKLDANREQRTITWTDPATKLQVRCVGVEYKDFPTVEWTVYFKNTGAADTPILEKIQALDVDVRAQRGGRVRAQPQHRQPVHPDRLPAVQGYARSGRIEAHHHRRRAADEQRSAVLQHRVAGRGSDRGPRLARPVGRRVHSRSDERPARRRRAGTDASQAASRRGGPVAAGRPAVLEGRLRPLAERLAAVDDGAQHAPARRQATPRRTWRRAARTSSAR